MTPLSRTGDYEKAFGSMAGLDTSYPTKDRLLATHLSMVLHQDSLLGYLPKRVVSMSSSILSSCPTQIPIATGLPHRLFKYEPSQYLNITSRSLLYGVS